MIMLMSFSMEMLSFVVKIKEKGGENVEEHKEEHKKEEKPASSDVEKNKTMGVLAYFIFFLPLLSAKDSKFAMYHANQSVILLIAWVISVAINVIPVIGTIVSPLAGLAVFILWIIGIINAAQGQMKPIPYIGNYTIIK